MKSNFVWTTFQYVKYKLTAKHRKGHGIHSPFIYDFVVNVLNKKADNKHFTANKLKQQSLNKIKTKIRIQDPGTGSIIRKSNIRSVKSLAKHSSTLYKYRCLTGLIAQHFAPEIIIELGTSLGLTTDILACMSPNSTIKTVEGSPEIFELAKRNFKLWKHNNIIAINSTFRQFINELEPINKTALVYIDGHHQGDATIEYFNAFWNKIPSNSIIIIGDIYWSKSMTEAWKEISAPKKNQYSLDLFYIGIVFKHKNCAGNNLVIKY